MLPRTRSSKNRGLGRLREVCCQDGSFVLLRGAFSPIPSLLPPLSPAHISLLSSSRILHIRPYINTKHTTNELPARRISGTKTTRPLTHPRSPQTRHLATLETSRRNLLSPTPIPTLEFLGPLRMRRRVLSWLDGVFCVSSFRHTY